VGITVSNVTAVNATTVTATFTIAAGANQSARNVTVTTPGGTSNAVVFTIVAPVLTSITPSTGNRSTSVPVSLVGSGFTGATGLNVSGGGAGAIGVTAFTVVSDTQITATFNIPAAATLGGHTVAVVTPGGNTGNVTFTVTGGIAFSAPTPALTTGTANTTTKTGLVTITNYLGASGSITLTPAPTVVKNGTAGGTFTVIAGGTCANGTVLVAPGGSCTVNVQYAPGTSTATATAHVQVTGTGFTSPVNGPNFNGN
jgi:hypothetical protein